MTLAVSIAQSRLHELYEYRDGNLYRKTSARGVKAGSKANYKHDKNYCEIYIEGKKYKLHRIVFMYHHGYMPKIIDHINGDKYDNRIENLREATYSENKKNLKIYKTNTSGYAGISFDKTRKKWFVSISINNKLKNLGRFRNIEDAINARKVAEENHFGFWARKPYPLHLINKALELTGDLQQA